MSSISIVIPVLGRAERAARLVASIRTTTRVPYSLLFVCSPDDPAAVSYARAGDSVAVDWQPGPGDFAKKINFGFARTDEEFVFCGATDLTFKAGWDTAALRVAEDSGAGVIGTWDGANPAVMAGRHSTHPLVRRAYAWDPGGTVDDTGAIYCELYDHQAVDNELIETAQSRGQWAFAEKSRVIHHHPFYDRRVARDPTYEKALAKGREDKMLFMRRRRLWQRDLRQQERLARRR